MALTIQSPGSLLTFILFVCLSEAVSNVYLAAKTTPAYPEICFAVDDLDSASDFEHV